MVIPDLSAPEVKPHHKLASATPIASVLDRALALLLDFLIFSPVVSLLIAGLVRQTKTYFLLNGESQEGFVAAGLVFLAVAFLTILLQSVFLYYWQATPGQFFMQIRVVSYPQGQERLSLNQCVLRSLMWCSGFFLLTIPFLEVLSHPLRRAFHERASDTLAITLKKNPDEGPYPLESRFLSSWMRMSYLFLLLFGVIAFFKTYHSLLAGDYKELKDHSSLYCKEMKTPELVGAERLDAALSLFLLNAISPECLEKEAEASLWGDPVNSQELAYLAKFFISEGDAQEKYLEKVCEKATSSSCQVAHFVHDEGNLEDLAAIDSSLWVTRVLLSDEKFSARDYSGSLALIQDLQKVPALKEALEKRFVRSVWALNEAGKKTRAQGRRPASAEDSDSWLEEFKERYDVR